MPKLTIRDDALWAKHIGDADLRRRVLDLPPEALLHLIVDGQRIAFRKMKNGRDGRATPGLRADETDLVSRAAWARLQSRRGEIVSLAVAESGERSDPYLAYLDDLMSEWKTPEDAAAFDDL